MKTCTKCKLEKPLSDYHKLNKAFDGHRPDCKECRLEGTRIYNEKNKDRIRQNYIDNRDVHIEYARKYRENNKEKVLASFKKHKENNKEKIKASHKKYIVNNKEKVNKRHKEYNNKYPKKKKARLAIRREILKGRMVKGPCEICGDEYVHGHHDDYDKPLVVRWLCPKHHSAWHKANGEGLNGS